MYKPWPDAEGSICTKVYLKQTKISCDSTEDLQLRPACKRNIQNRHRMKSFEVAPLGWASHCRPWRVLLDVCFEVLQFP